MGDLKAIEDIITKVFENFRKLTPALIAVAIVTGVVLFAPINILEKLGMKTIPEAIRLAIGICFLFSIMLIISILLFYCFDRIQNWHHRFRKIKECRMLNEEQKGILKCLLVSEERNVYLKSTDVNTVFLVSKGFLCKPSQIITGSLMRENLCEYCPQPWVVELWLKNPKLFD